MQIAKIHRSKYLIATVLLLSLLIILLKYSTTLASSNSTNIIDQRMHLFKQSEKSIRAIRHYIKVAEIDLASNEIEFHIQWSNEMLDYFPVGSQASVNNKSRAAGDIWNNWEKFINYKLEYQKKAEALKFALQLQDDGLVKQSFVDMASACKSCHQSFRN